MSALDQASDIRSGEELPIEALETYLRAHEAIEPFAEIRVRQFRKGHSNLTYLVYLDDREYVLRRPPFGANIKSAHDMGREFKVLHKLWTQWSLAPQAQLMCEDPEVIGAPFYLMDRVNGIILRSKPKPEWGMGAPELKRISTSMIHALHTLHNVDLGKAGLSDLGKPEGYVQRQVGGWSKRYKKSQTDELPDIDQVIDWLAKESEGKTSVAGLIHNDFKHDNVVLDPKTFEVIAVLDWEMATIGDVWMDLGTTLGYWIEASDSAEMKMLPFGPTTLKGTLTRQEVVDTYASLCGEAPESMVFYYVFGLFKVSVIAQQIYRRFVDGHTKDPRFQMMIMGVRLLGQQAVRAIEKGRISGLAG